MLTMMRRLRAAFFVPAILAGGLVLAGCETEDNPVVQALHKAVPAECPAQQAVRVGAFVSAIDTAVEGQGMVAAAAAPAVAELAAIRLAGGETDAVVVALLYGQIVSAVAPRAYIYFKVRGEVYGDADLTGIFKAAADRVLNNAKAVTKMRAAVKAADCAA